MTAPPPPTTTKKKSPARCRSAPASLSPNGEQDARSICSIRPASTCSSTKPRWCCRSWKPRWLWSTASPASKLSRRGVGIRAKKSDLPRVIVVSRMDRDRADADACWSRCTKLSGARSFRCNSRSASEKSFNGVVDLVTMKAYTYEMGGNGKGKESRNSRRSGRARPGSAREAGGAGCRRQRRADGRVLREGHDSRRASDSCAARSHSRRQDFPGAVYVGTRKHRRRQADGLHRRLHARRDRTSPRCTDGRRQQRRSRRAARRRIPSALSSICLQNRVRSVRRAHLVLQGLLRRV